MTKIEDSIEIEVTPEKLSGYLMDVDNLPSYLPISDVQVLESGDDRTKFRHKITAVGRTMDVVCETKLVEKDRKLTFNTLEGMRVEGTWLLESTQKGTRLALVLEYQPPGWIFGKILDVLKMRKEMKRLYSGSLEKLKGILEA